MMYDYCDLCAHITCVPLVPHTRTYTHIHTRTRTGGGGIFVPIFILVVGLDAKEAIPLSQVSLVVCVCVCAFCVVICSIPINSACNTHTRTHMREWLRCINSYTYVSYSKQHVYSVLHVE